MTVVAVLSMKGGVGKTTVALGLASTAWDRGQRALVIDLDPQANASMALETKAEFTTSDVLADARPGVAADAVVASGWGESVMVIASERSLELRHAGGGPQSGLRLRTALATLPKTFDLVIIDCPPSLGELTRNALSAADLAVIVTEPNYFAVHGAAEAVEAVSVIAATSNPRLRTAAIVINRMNVEDREHRLHADQLTAEHGDLVFARSLPDCSGVPRSQRAGTPIHAWSSPGATDIAESFDDLFDALRPPRRPARRVLSLRRFFT